jgi:serine protease AprX
VKRQIMSTASAFSSTTNIYRGNGTTDIRQAETKPMNNSAQSNQFWGTGTGSIGAARGTMTVDDGFGAIRGEVDVFGQAWNGKAWARATAAGTVWNGGTWRGELWTASGWSNGAWDPVTWTALDWNARMWRSDDWDARMWRDGS